MIAVIMLGLGIGATTAVFSLVNAVLLRPMPFQEPHQLVWVWSLDSRRGLQQWVSYPDLLDWREQARSFAQLVGTGGGSELVLTGKGEPQRFESLIVTTNFFSTLGVPPLLGTTSSEAGEAQGWAVVLSYQCWQRTFGGDSAMVGQSITLSGRSYAVIGVMPPEFRFPIQANPVDVWVLMRDDQFNPALRSRRDARLIEVIGRLEPGVTVQQAQAEMEVLAANLSRDYPATNDGVGVRVVPAGEQVVGNLSRMLFTLLVAVGCVLLIACVNVANLLLARAAARQDEIATRAALGASRVRIAVDLLVESVPLAVGGSVVGVLIAVWAVGAVVPLLPADLPRADEIAVDTTVLGFTILVSAATALVFGLAPAWAASQPDLALTLQQAGSTRATGRLLKRMSTALVVVEIALAMVLLAGGGLLLNSFCRLSRPDPGFDPRNVLTFRIGWPTAAYTGVQSARAFDEVRARLQAIPGVQSASIGLQLPARGQPVLDDVLPHLEVEGREIAPGDRLRASMIVVQPGYFGTLGIPITRGRDFDERDRVGGGLVTIINESLARAYFPNEDPLGRRLAMDSWTFQGRRTREIVGVSADVRHQGFEGPLPALVYLPLAQYPIGESHLVVKTAGEPLQFVGAVRAAIRSIDPDQPIDDIETLEQRLTTSMATDRIVAVLLASFAALALSLAAGGLYALLSYMVAQRTRELGVRITLGAEPRKLTMLVVRQGLSMTAAGVAIGVIGAVVSTRAIRAHLFGISAVDPITFMAVILLLLVTAGVASVMPARRATSIDPLVALRHP